MQCVQNVFLSAFLERKFLVGRPNSVKLNVVNSMQCDNNQRNKETKNTTMQTGKCRGSARGFLRKCQPPAWQRFPGGIEGQEREGRSARPRRRERSKTRSRDATDGKAKEVKTSAVLHVLGNGAQVDHHSDPRLVRESQQNGKRYGDSKRGSTSVHAEVCKYCAQEARR